jgi:hypothetical protein
VMLLHGFSTYLRISKEVYKSPEIVATWIAELEGGKSSPLVERGSSG